MQLLIGTIPCPWEEWVKQVTPEVTSDPEVSCLEGEGKAYPAQYDTESLTP